MPTVTVQVLSGNIKQLSADSYLFFPMDFMVITEDTALLKRDFITQKIWMLL
ncbi:MAG: hypothetical protein IPH68_12850 [Chitinophagaceae bacterium]|nr:hypothetical protein [Chitinophagaceae bacterium]